MLIQEGVFSSVSYSFLGSHDNVAKGVLSGRFAAGGLKPNVARRYVGKGLKIIAQSEPIYEHLLVIGPKVEPAVADKVQAALLNLTDPEILSAIKKDLRGFAQVQAADYENLQHIIKIVDEKLL